MRQTGAHAELVWEYGRIQPIIFVLCALVTCSLMLYLIFMGGEEVFNWCVSASFEGCLVLAIFGYFVFLALWSAWIMYLAFSTAVRVAVNNGIVALTFPLGVTRKFPLRTVSRIEKKKGSKWAPHPLNNVSGVIKINVGNRSYWFNPGGEADPIYEQMRDAMQI